MGRALFARVSGLAAGLLFVIAGLASPAVAAEGAGGTPILVYHRFDPTVAGSTAVTAAAFQEQLAWLARHDYRIVPLRTALAELNETSPREHGRAAVITVDDGHRSVYTVLFPLIRRAKAPVTLFIYPSAISNAPYALTWAQLKEMQASGWVDVEAHTYWHPNFKIERRRRSPADYAAFVDNQLTRSKAAIERQLGGRADLLSWPFGIVDADLEAAAKRAGFTAAFAYAGGPARPGDDRFALPRIPVTDADRGARFAARLDSRNHRTEGP